MPGNRHVKRAGYLREVALGLEGHRAFVDAVTFKSLGGRAGLDVPQGVQGVLGGAKAWRGAAALLEGMSASSSEDGSGPVTCAQT